MTIFERAMINDLKYFQENSFDINLTDDSGRGLLHFAVLGSSFEVINFLITKGANVNLVDHDGETPIFDCARKSKLEIAKKLIINHAKLNFKNIKGENLSHLASYKGDLTFLKLLVENEVEFNSETINLEFPVHYAVLAGNIDIIKYILKQSNQSFLLKDKNDNTLLHYACQTTNSLLIYFLISEGVNPNLLNNNFESAIFNAVRFGTKETLTALLESETYIDIYNINNESPIDYTNIYERFDLETLLTNYKMLPKYERLIKRQELALATLNRDKRLVNQLINKKALLRKDSYNYTALDYANLYNLKEIKELLRNAIKL